LKNKETKTAMERYIAGPLLRILRQPAFLLCIVLLGICAGGLQVAAEKMKWHFRKEAVPLRKSLDDLDAAKLAPYKLLRSDKIQNKEVEAELGTKDYIQWYLEDPTVPEKDPSRFMLLFITYYTGEPDKVPHVPEVCYQGGGSLVEKREDTEMSILGKSGKTESIPIRVLEMNMPGLMSQESRTVIYFFGVNGDYLKDRNEVRRRLNNLRDRYAYFSKVEVSFINSRPGDSEILAAAMERFCQKLLPILWEDHWPDWDALTRKK